MLLKGFIFDYEENGEKTELEYEIPENLQVGITFSLPTPVEEAACITGYIYALLPEARFELGKLELHGIILEDDENTKKINFPNGMKKFQFAAPDFKTAESMRNLMGDIYIQKLREEIPVAIS